MGIPFQRRMDRQVIACHKATGWIDESGEGAAGRIQIGRRKKMPRAGTAGMGQNGPLPLPFITQIEPADTADFRQGRLL